MSSTLEPGRVVAGRYRVERQIGEGGVGSVYLVRHLFTDEELALKVLQSHALRDQDAVERFRREARAPARIGGDHVTRVTDADTAPDLDNAPFLVMELLRGRDLTAVVADRGPLPPLLALELMKQAARALDKAHGLSIIHRDLKPDNLFLTEREDGSPCIKLLDFGIARLGDGGATDKKTQAGLVFGTPGYMAPEQMTGEVDLVSPATDVWALGLVAFYLLVGHDFWEATTLTRLYATILAEPIPLPSQRGATLGAAFDVWFGRCVARDPGQRFQTAGEATTALATALSTRTSGPPLSLPPLDRVERGPSRPDLPPYLPPHAPPYAPPTARALASSPPDVRFVAEPAPVSPLSPRARGVAVVAAALAAVVVLGAGIVAWVTISSGGDGAPTTTTSATAPLIPATPTAAEPLPAPAPAATANAAPKAKSSADSTARPAAADEAPPAQAVAVGPARTAWDPRARGATRDQQDRLDALQRLCDQGTVTAAECAAKRGAILRGDP